MPLGARLHPPVEDVGLGQELADHGDGVEDLDEARLVVVERALRRAPHPLAELTETVVGLGAAQLVDHVEPGQRPDAVGAGGVAERLPVCGLEVRVLVGDLAEVVPVGLGIDAVGQQFAVGVDHP